MSHYLQINGQRLIDSLYALGEHGALPAAAYAAWQRLPKIKPAGTLL